MLSAYDSSLTALATAIQLVASINGVSSMTIAEDSRIILVLAETVSLLQDHVLIQTNINVSKKALWWIRLDDVFKDKTPKKNVDEAMVVTLYRYGTLAGRNFVIAWGKRKGVCNSF